MNLMACVIAFVFGWLCGDLLGALYSCRRHDRRSGRDGR